jgi:hypothetical protein
MTMIAAAVVLAAAIMVPTSARPEGEAQPSGAASVEQLLMVAAAPDEQAAGPADRRPDPIRHRGRRARAGLSLEFIQECLDVAREVDPALADRLEEARREQPPEEFARALREAQNLRRLSALKKEDPQLYDVKVRELRIDAQVDRVLKELATARRTSSEGAEDLEAQLHGLVQQQVAFSLIARGMYLNRLGKQMKALRDQLEHDAGHSRQAVNRRMKQLLGELEEDASRAAPAR